MKSNKKSISPFSVIICSILVLYAVILFLFLYWGVITALKSYDDFTKTGGIGNNAFGLPRLYGTELSSRGRLLWPWEWEFMNFVNVAQFFEVEHPITGEPIPFYEQLAYTFLYTFGCAFFSTLCPCIVAYATQKFKFGFNKVVDILVIISMSLPIIGAQASMLSLMSRWGLYNTMLGLYIQKFHFANMYYLMFSAIFKGVSKEYYEAAYIDGANEFQIMLKIAFPLVLPSFGLVYLLYFITYWNDYQTLLIYAPARPTIVYGLFKVMTESTGGSIRGQTPVQMAGCMLITMPVIALFIIFRNKLMGNLTIGGVKE